MPNLTKRQESFLKRRAFEVMVNRVQSWDGYITRAKAPTETIDAQDNSIESPAISAMERVAVILDIFTTEAKEDDEARQRHANSTNKLVISKVVRVATSSETCT